MTGLNFGVTPKVQPVAVVAFDFRREVHRVPFSFIAFSTVIVRMEVHIYAGTVLYNGCKLCRCYGETIMI